MRVLRLLDAWWSRWNRQTLRFFPQDQTPTTLQTPACVVPFGERLSTNLCAIFLSSQVGIYIFGVFLTWYFGGLFRRYLRDSFRVSGSRQPLSANPIKKNPVWILERLLRWPCTTVKGSHSHPLSFCTSVPEETCQSYTVEVEALLKCSSFRIPHCCKWISLQISP